MKALKEIILGLYLVSTAALAGQDSVITSLAIEKAQVKPEQAMEIVSKQYSGKLSEFSVDDRDHDHKMVYELEVVDQTRGEKIEVSVDPDTGAIQEQERDRFSSRKYGSFFNGITLEKAVAEAKKMVPGTLLEAELEHEKGVVFFEIELMTDQGVRKVIVDVETGKPIPVATRNFHKD